MAEKPGWNLVRESLRQIGTLSPDCAVQAADLQSNNSGGSRKVRSDTSINARLIPQDDAWVLVLERALEQSVQQVWAALTLAEMISSWGPFSTDRDLTATGTVHLSHIDRPEVDERQGAVLEVSAPDLLVFQWGSDVLRWELRDDEDGTLLILQHCFADRSNAPSYAAGWHLCLEGLAGRLAGKEMPSMVGENALNHGWQALYVQYAKQLGINLW